jgi:hypothetical protein
VIDVSRKEIIHRELSGDWREESSRWRVDLAIVGTNTQNSRTLLDLFGSGFWILDAIIICHRRPTPIELLLLFVGY